MNYISTRGNISPTDISHVINYGMVPSEGLFVPESIPELDLLDLREKNNYNDIAFEVLKKYLCNDRLSYTYDEIKDYIKNSYNSSKFAHSDIVPLKIIDENRAILELWHGPTAAFKDIALQLMPYLLVGAKKKLNNDKETVILVATSGDTGKAALEGFKNIPGIKIIVFYPKDGISKIQELQMVTTDGDNTFVVGVNGNFDDCQNMVKKIFADEEYNNELNKKGYELSSANSINWGRLVPQIVYYVWGYINFIKKYNYGIRFEVNFCVPTGNFGNILAAYYAKRMGVPIKKLICASNRNKILTDFINTGIYDRKRIFYKTISPSMDILISSNLERFLFEITNHNALKIRKWYNDLTKSKIFKVDLSTKYKIKEILYGNFANDEDTLNTIKTFFDKYNYLIDTHTAVGIKVVNDYINETNDNTPTIICSTASPYKFNKSVYYALTNDNSEIDEFEIINKISNITNTDIHRSLKDLDKKPIIHNKTISTEQGKNLIKEILEI